MQIRPYRPDDAAHLATIFYRSVREVARRYYSKAQVEAWAPALGDPIGWNSRATDGRLTIVAVDSADKPIAFGDMETDGHVDHLFSSPEALGTGAASAIYNRLELHARESRLTRLYVEASECAFAFFERKGFTKVRRNDFAKGGVSIHNYTMEKALAVMTVSDVPSPIDLRLMSDATEWEAAAMQKRPWRTEVFTRFARELEQMDPPALRVLELGSGPGFLAHTLLGQLAGLRMTLLDFSEAMHVLARKRLGAMSSRVDFLIRSFKEPAWSRDLGTFDAVVTNQAVHELRHKRHAEELHRQTATVLRRGGTYLVCDHYRGPDGMANDQLYMTEAEQKAALEAAGFIAVTQVLLLRGLSMHRAIAP
jgi:SAM-dependent methyltransferase/GNAT superfamily N-acetyltransferase